MWVGGEPGEKRGATAASWGPRGEVGPWAGATRLGLLVPGADPAVLASGSNRTQELPEGMG